MATYVTLIRFTEQGAKHVQDTCGRATEFTAAANKVGVKVRDVFWTLGSMDGVLVFDAADDETATGAMLSLSSRGNVHTQTSRAFTAAEMTKILENRPK